MRAIRVCVAACALLGGCKGAENNPSTVGPTGSTATPGPDLPRVDDDHAVADVAAVPKPVAIVWIDAGGAFEVAQVEGAWTGAFPTGKRTHASTLGAARRVLGEDRGEDTRTNGRADDPPPPPPEDMPDDGRDESGGTGTAMALDEGKMGKKDSDRAEGQYKMKQDNADPQLARQQAIEQARAAGILGNPRVRIRDVVPSLPIAELRPDNDVVVAAAPGAPALPLVNLVAAESGAIAVASHGKLAVLARGYGSLPSASFDSFDPPAWIELHVSADGVHVVETSKHDQTVIAWKQGGADRDALRAAYGKLKAERFGNSAATVDVLVGPGATAQELVDVLATLDQLGVTGTSLGELKGTTEARLAQFAENAKPHVSIGQPNANGDLDKAIIRRYVKANLAGITACYERALLAKPGLSGTVQVQFFITASGAVSSSEAVGVDPDVASCVAGVIKGIAFPKPKGGGGVQVNYPFSFRPTTGM